MLREKRKLEELETRKVRYGTTPWNAKQNGFVASDGKNRRI